MVENANEASNGAFKKQTIVSVLLSGDKDAEIRKCVISLEI